MTAHTPQRATRRAVALAALLAVAAPAIAQPSGSWQVHEGPDTPYSFGTTVENGQNLGFLNGGDVPPASDAGWAPASGDLSLRWTGGQTVPCRAAADYAYFQTTVFPADGDRYAISFENVDDAAIVTVYNEDNPRGLDVEGSVVGLRERKTVDVTPALLAGATNRIVVTLANVCGPSGTLHLQVKVEPGEPMAGGGDDGAAMAMACKGALQTLLANNYDFATERDPAAVRPGAQMSFAAAYARFEEVAPDCQLLLEEPEAYIPADRMGALNALVSRHQATIADEHDPALSFTERTGYLVGPAGVVNQGGRTVQMCPQLHQRQFSCDRSPARIALSAQLLIEYMDVVASGGAVGSASGAMGAPAPGTRFMLTSMSYDGDECLEGNGRGGQFGGTSVMTPCAGQSGQLFEAVPSNVDGFVKLRTLDRGPNECLEGNAPESGTMNGAAFMDDCQDVSGQLWRFTPTQHDGFYRLQTAWRGEGECLEANGRGSQVHGGAAFMDTCQDVTGQYWRVVPAGN
jgi:hypothetical protein